MQDEQQFENINTTTEDTQTEEMLPTAAEELQQDDQTPPEPVEGDLENQQD